MYRNGLMCLAKGDLPAVDRPGSQRQEIILPWEGGETRTYGVAWKVTAPIRASPPALFVKSSGGPC